MQGSGVKDKLCSDFHAMGHESWLASLLSVCGLENQASGNSGDARSKSQEAMKVLESSKAQE